VHLLSVHFTLPERLEPPEDIRAFQLYCSIAYALPIIFAHHRSELVKRQRAITAVRGYRWIGQCKLTRYIRIRPSLDQHFVQHVTDITHKRVIRSHTNCDEV